MLQFTQFCQYELYTARKEIIRKPDYQQDSLASAPHIGKSLGKISLEGNIKELLIFLEILVYPQGFTFSFTSCLRLKNT